MKSMKLGGSTLWEIKICMMKMKKMGCQKAREKREFCKGDEETNVEDGWRTVARRQIKSRLTFSFFISGFSDATSVEDFQKAVKHLGSITDVFIARKRRFNGKRFGFIRFKNVGDIVRLENELNSLSLGGSKIKANLSQVPRGGTKPLEGSHRTKLGLNQPSMKSVIVGGHSEGTLTGGISFRDVVSGKPPALEASRSVHDVQRINGDSGSFKWKSIQIPEEAGNYPASFFNRTLIEEALDGGSLCSVKLLLNEGGGAYFDVVYVGGLHLFLVFNHSEKAESFLKDKEGWWKNYFKSLVIWNRQARPNFVEEEIVTGPQRSPVVGYEDDGTEDWDEGDDWDDRLTEESDHPVEPGIEVDSGVEFQENDRRNYKVRETGQAYELEEDVDDFSSTVGPNGTILDSVGLQLGANIGTGPLNQVGPVFSFELISRMPDLSGPLSSFNSSQEKVISLPTQIRVVSKSKKTPKDQIHMGGGKKIFWGNIAKRRGVTGKSMCSFDSMKSPIKGGPMSKNGEMAPNNFNEEVSRTIRIGAFVGMELVRCVDQVEGIGDY
ncbi:hypothetical protein SSX86_007471 [Deinandra increscens subsp. villosa]|uniref:RRM domain-containing protein n=1 Tax=Deinandra increscens subsp. villosa TaxID=3103831 RepID=A0AAP0DI45_9ASTR